VIKFTQTDQVLNAHSSSIYIKVDVKHFRSHLTQGISYLKRGRKSIDAHRGEVWLNADDLAKLEVNR
jgi:hypothetical protein